MVQTRHAVAVADEHRDDRVDTIDYKMVTFSLAGKEYGIDIMKVKEIAKYGRFTYVPNAPPYVRGVYNLRGEIISIIDLRTMFFLPPPEREDGRVEEGLILRIGDKLVGVVVDEIDKVVGISQADIQPPHPLFGDINIKYISGVVEHDDKLYIILDVERILGKPADTEGEPAGDSLSVTQGGSIPVDRVVPVATTPSAARVPDYSPAAPVPVEPEPEPDAPIDLTFISETLATFRNFHVTELNSIWVHERFQTWERERSADGKELQFADEHDADAFLAPFYSIHTGQLWGEEYISALVKSLPDIGSSVIGVWNPGAARGHETYSLACTLLRRYPDARIKIWAGDSDLLAISSAPNLTFADAGIAPTLRDNMVSAREGLAFSQRIKEMVLFEYQDVVNGNTVPEPAIVFARDVLSFLAPNDQESVFRQLSDQLKQGGVLILGENEHPLDTSAWKAIPDVPVTVYGRK